MKNKLYVSFIILTLVFFTSSVYNTVLKKNEVLEVSSSNANYQDVTKMLLNLKTYAISGTVTYISNDGENSFNILQYGKNDGTYRIEILNDDGSKITTIYDGKAIFQFNDKMKGSVNVTTNENSERSEIFITKFIKNYETSNDVSVLVSNTSDGSMTVLEAKIPGNHAYFSSERLFVDNKTNLPKKLIIYDKDNIERVILEYEQFIANPTLDEEIFSTKR